MRSIEQQIVSIAKDFRARKVTGRTQRTKRDRIESENGKVSIYLWNTKVAELNDDNLTLFSGGYRSPTTKSRLNALLRGFGCNWSISQRNFAWQLHEHTGFLKPLDFAEGSTFITNK